MDGHGQSKTVEKKLQYIKKALQKNRRIEVLVESPKEAYIQGVLARGDRRLGAVLAACAAIVVASPSRLN